MSSENSWSFRVKPGLLVVSVPSGIEPPTSLFTVTWRLASMTRSAGTRLCPIVNNAEL